MMCGLSVSVMLHQAEPCLRGALAGRDEDVGVYSAQKRSENYGFSHTSNARNEIIELLDEEAVVREDKLIADREAVHRRERGEPLHNAVGGGDVGVPGLNLEAGSKSRARTNHVVAVESGSGNCEA